MESLNTGINDLYKQYMENSIVKLKRDIIEYIDSIKNEKIIQPKEIKPRVTDGKTNILFWMNSNKNNNGNYEYLIKVLKPGDAVYRSQLKKLIKDNKKYYDLFDSCIINRDDFINIISNKDIISDYVTFDKVIKIKRKGEFKNNIFKQIIDTIKGYESD